MYDQTIVATLLGGLQGSISVLLTALAGYLAASYGLLDRRTVTIISKLSAKVFLPALMINSMGPHLTSDRIEEFWIMPVWGFVSSVFGHFLGWLGTVVFKLPNWVIIASGRANSSALPLLLLKSLQSTGVLDMISRPGESPKETLTRAQTMVLLNSIIQQMFTFTIGPAVLLRNRTDVQDSDENANHLRYPSHHSFATNRDPEHVGLLDEDEDEDDSIADLRRSPDQLEAAPDYLHPAHSVFAKVTGRMKGISGKMKPIKIMYGLLNAPMIGGVIALFLGIIPSLHHIFFDVDGALYSTVTNAIGNVGDLFVSFQMIILGAQLALVPSANPGVGPTAYALSIRFLTMPAVALFFVYTTAGRGWYDDDPLMWFLLILIPSGPSAMLLISVSEIANIDQGSISGYLTISYLASPLIAIVCSVGLKVVEIVEKRR